MQLPVFSGAAAGRAGATLLLSAGAAPDLAVPEELLWRYSDVLDDLAEQEGGDVASAMHWDRRATAVRMFELLVGTSLPDLLETQLPENRDHFAGAQDRQLTHRLRRDRLNPYELSI